MLSRLLHKWGMGKEQPPPSGRRQAAVSASSALPFDWRPGDLIAGRYRVEQIMAGSMGKVYISEHLGWRTRMAVKSPRPEVMADREGMRRILKEANGWIRMGMHPNIATCYYVLAIEKVPHLFIEYVDGGSLADWLRAGKCRDLRTALSLAVQFCHGMELAHAHGIVHRDIKPANILITRNSLLKITDFGILLTIGEEDGALSEGEGDKTVGFRGTPGFAAPEQFHDTHAVDGRADIFSFGICLWLMLCGRKPYQKNSVRSEVPEPEPLDPAVTFPGVLAAALKKCVAYDPGDRFPDFASLRKTLDEAYTALFNVSCPYAVLPQVDLRADSLNNRAVSMVELGKPDKAEEFLRQALEINDVLPEAIHNLILLQVRSGQLGPERARRKLEAALKRLGKEPILSALREHLAGEESATGEGGAPELRLCAPQTSLDVFRNGQLYQSVGRSMLDHLEHSRYAPCHQVLLTSWRSSGFKKDKPFTTIYERLLLEGRKKTVESAQRVAVLHGSRQPADCLAYVPFSRKIVTGSREGQIIIWDFALKRKICVLGKRGLPVCALAANPKGKLVAVGTGDGAVGLWAVGSFRQTGVRASHAGPVTALAFSGDGRWLVSGGENGSLVSVHLPTGRECRYQAAGCGAIRALSVDEKGGTFIAGSSDGKLRFWETGKPDYLRVIEAHADRVTGLSAAPGGKKIASGGGDRLLKLWDSQSGRCLKIMEAHEEPVTAVQFLSDGTHLASGCGDDIIKIWHGESGECRVVLDGRGDGILSLAPGPKPHLFLAGCRDGAVLLWMVIYSLEFD
ncbi:MAG: protein kinase [Desulfobacteraceae bacterium]|nr:protein kinase [Desulfobacteraceae bacterium]